MRKYLKKILIILSLILVAGCAPYKQEGSQVEIDGITAPNTIEITSSGFNPPELTINAGETVTFINKDTEPHWPASAMHPTHLLYPVTGGCIGSKFDACKELAQGETFTFAFNEIGAWKYHDHLKPGVYFGSVTVK